MRSRSETRLWVIAVALLLARTLSVDASLLHEAAAPAGSDRPGQAEISRALEAVKADPNLATEFTIKTLHWKDADEPKRPEQPGWLAWIAGLFQWLERTTRLLLWLAAAALAGLLVVYITGIVRRYRPQSREEAFVAPTHVRDLDIRPETLPQDVGAAARTLWDRGEHRVALALLYRGMLSRLAHVHGVPVRDSSTEGDCLALTSTHLTARRHEYTSRLVRVWQRFVYGAEEIDASLIYVLCDGFGGALDAGSELESGTREGAA